MPRLPALVALLLSAAMQAVLAQGDFKPVDQAAAQPDFFAFRARLQAAVARRDKEAVLAVIHKDIKNSFGGNGGVDEFKQVWELDKPGTPLWEELAQVLSLGGSFMGDGRFVAPYVFSRWPSGTDPYGFVAVIGTGVRVRAEASASAMSTHSLSFEIVEELQTRATNDAWVAVILADGKTGFVDKRFVRSPLDYRAIFEMSAGRWQITMFIAGD